jgi:hypothetical protein
MAHAERARVMRPVHIPAHIILLTLLTWLVLQLAACDAHEAGDAVPSSADIELTCQAWAQVGCAKNEACGVLSGTRASCVSDTLARCVRSVGEGEASCRAAHLEAIVDCTPDLEATSCDVYCNDYPSGRQCRYFCPYFCPAAGE